MFLESWTRGEQRPQSSPFPSFVLLCLLQPLHPVKNLQLPCRIRSEGQLGMLRTGLAAKLGAFGIEPELSGATDWPVLPLQELSGM